MRRRGLTKEVHAHASEEDEVARLTAHGFRGQSFYLFEIIADHMDVVLPPNELTGPFLRGHLCESTASS